MPSIIDVFFLFEFRLCDDGVSENQMRREKETALPTNCASVWSQAQMDNVYN